MSADAEKHRFVGLRRDCMTLTLTPDTETRLRTMAEGYGLNPAELHEDLLRQALAAAEAELSETLAGLDESAEAVDAGRWITVDELDQRLTAQATSIRAAKANAGSSTETLDKVTC